VTNAARARRFIEGSNPPPTNGIDTANIWPKFLVAMEFAVTAQSG
jgi:hypothetical protein